MYKQFQTKFLALLAIMLMGLGSAWAEETVLFHETFGNNTGSARDWNDSYSVKSGVAAVYSGITGYTVSNAKQGKNTTGSTQSGLNQSTQGTDASIIIGPLNVADYNNLTLTYQWKAASIKGTYFTQAYYATSSTGEYTEITGTGNGATTFVERNYSLPATAQVSTLYIKIVFNTSNTQAIIDEVELKGEGGSSQISVAAPTFSPAEGEVDYNTTISLTQDDAYAIVFTTNGDTPSWTNNVGTIYSNTKKPVITQDLTVKAIAVQLDSDSNPIESEVASATYTVKRPDAPTFNPAAGAVAEGTTVTISGRPSGGKLMYTTDGTNPSYSSNNGIVFAEGDVITINQAMTIKAIAVDAHDFESSVASASYTIYDPNAPGTQNNPYTVAQAIENTPSTGTSDNVYIQGIVSSFHANDIVSDGSNYRYYISDDGTTENELLVYKGKGLNQATFTNAEDLMVGDRVIIYGGLTTYNNTKEIAANNYIVSLTRKTLTSIALSGTYPTTFVEGSTFSHEGIVVTATYDDNSTVDVTERATFSEPNMTQVGEQTVTVTYLDKTATYTINITALPTHTATFSVEGLTSTQDFKEGAAIVFPNVSNRNGFTFVGWVTSTINGTQSTAPEMVTNATMGNADITYYAVFAEGTTSSEPASATISYATEGVPTSYGDANTFTEYTLTGIKFMIQQMYKNGEKLQWRANGNSNGTGTMYNVDAINKIQSIVLTYDSSDGNKNFTVHVGNEANPTAGTSITPAANENVYTFDCSAYNASYFVLTNGEYAGYLTSIVINYLHETSNFSNYCTTIPTPTITVADATLNVDAAEHEGTMAITYQNLDITGMSDFDIQYYDSNNNELEANPSWIMVEVAEQDPQVGEGYVVSYYMEENIMTDPRSVYFKVYALDGDANEVYSNLVTITQAAASTATITLNAACHDADGMVYGTYSNTSAFVVSDDITVAEVGIVDGKLNVKEYETGAIVPANTGVMVSALKGGDYTVTLTDEEGTSVLGTQNNLRPTGAEGINATKMAEENPACMYYRLTMHNGETIGFWWGADDGAAFAVAANKAYLAVPANQAKDGFAFGNGGDATSISTIDNGQLTMENAYNLQGQKVGSEYKGIVIVNGKKIMVK